VTVSTTLHVYGHPTVLLDNTIIPPCTSHRNCSSHNSDSGCTPTPLTQFSILYGNYGSPYYKLYPWAHLNTKCRLQSVTWTSLSVTLPALCLKTQPWPHLLKKRNHTRNTLSLDALINSESTLSLHSIIRQDECEYTYTGICTTNTNAACINQPHISRINLALTN